MPPRSFNGWVQWAMDELNFTLGDAEKLAEQRLLWQKQKKPADPEQDSLFEDSERVQAASGDQPQADAGRSPPRQRRPPAPGYDPRTSDWEGF